MFRLELGSTRRYCDGLTRRSFLQLGVAGMASVGLPRLLRAKADSADRLGSGKNTSVILIWLDGGPSHMDLYDLKPDAPAEYRGIWKPIRTKVPGFDISELFPRQAQVTDKFSIVRSLHHDTGDHFAGGHRMLTAKDMGVSGANTDRKFPSLGAIVAREIGPRRPGLPAYVAVPHASSIGSTPGYFGAHMLGAQYNPFPTGGDPNAPSFEVQNLNLAHGLTLERLEDRRSLVRHFDTARRSLDSLPASRRPWIASRGRRMSSSAARPHDRPSRSTRKIPGSATSMGGTPGDRAHSWPGGWSRPAARSSPCTSAVGITTGT